MTTEDHLKDVQTGTAIIGELIKAAGDNEDVKQATKNLGKTVLTLTKTIDNILIPLAAVNFAIDKARNYYAENFAKDLEKLTADIPQENLIEPKASIAGPALQGLAFSHEEPDLKQMYLNLIASTMDDRVANKAHPAFVEMIKQLTAEEAGLLKLFLTATGYVPITQIKKTLANGTILIENHILNLRHAATNQQVEVEGLAAMVDNWIRLGLFTVDYDKQLVAENAYSWVSTHPTILKHKNPAIHNPDEIISGNGVLIATDLGKQFAKSIGFYS